MERKLDYCFFVMYVMYVCAIGMHVTSSIISISGHEKIQRQIKGIEITLDSLCHDYLAEVKRVRAKDNKGRVPDGPRSYTEMKTQVSGPVFFKNEP